MASPLIIDVHMHIFESKAMGRQAKAQYPGWEFGEGAPLPPYSEYDGDVEDAAASLIEAGASRAVMVHFHHPLIGLQAGIDERLGEAGGEERARAVAEADPTAGEVLKADNVKACASVREHPEILPFVSIDPWVLGPDEAADHLADLAKNHGARGVKLHAGSQRFAMDDRRMWPVYDACVQLDIAIVAHSGRDLGETQYSDPRSYRGVYEAFPRLKLVMAHLGNGSWRQTKEVADAFPNALFDTSEITEWHGAPLAPTREELAGLIRDIGPERIMMGTDLPWWSPTHCVQGILDMPVLSHSEKEAILGANAARILGI